ncbi:L-aminopeptidase/D-esterase [Pseudonocardia thermophila]|jgi:L-aminopeptidase/D-esterase|uniref:L-aminopeptidase/D-esterase n=1 Tax=Pseudonocardia thermophila TaxID=1848 RepID=A0A1M6YD65_PSETH|nr:P1 family peptidase [Pseudonocardia thermophila]SHL16073.1 L-aminopeptidase/D-esterase [Pseudonocardia thermophila]
MRTGPGNSLTDVEGLRVGHAEVTRGLSGTTVVLAPEGGMVAGVDARGAAPGTRETDLLQPGNMVQRVHAIVLSGGSAFGLASATGVMEELEAAGVGLPTSGGIVPIVPAAVVYDLGRGGPDGQRPGPETGAAAVAAATTQVGTGCVGAGTGTVAGGLKGGVGTASVVLPNGTTVAALAVVNAAGSPVDPATGQLLGARHGLPGEFPDEPVDAEAVAAARVVTRAVPGTHTTLAVVATDATLDKAQCARLATMGHDGLARAIAPVHTMFDGDVIFGVSTAARPVPDLMQLYDLQAAAADVVTRAVVHGVLAATSVRTEGGAWTAYRDAAGLA